MPTICQLYESYIEIFRIFKAIDWAKRINLSPSVKKSRAKKMTIGHSGEKCGNSLSHKVWEKGVILFHKCYVCYRFKVNYFKLIVDKFYEQRFKMDVKVKCVTKFSSDDEQAY